MLGEPVARFSLPVPPSANALFTYRAGSRQRIKTDAYRAWLSEAGYAIVMTRKCPLEPIGRCRVAIDLPFSRVRDIDNAIKPIADLLVRQHVIKDDRWVDELLVRRVATTEPLMVTVWQLT